MVWSRPDLPAAFRLKSAKTGHFCVAPHLRKAEGMTTTSQTLTRPLAALEAQPAEGPGLVGRVRHAIASARCQLHGHAPRLCFDRERIFLYCSECRLESSGWALDRPQPRVRQKGAPDRYSRYAWLTASCALQSRVASGALVLD
jgi:hypothetical protein